MMAYGTLVNSYYEHILAKELYALIASGHHITPYLTTPIFGDIMPYWIAKRKVHSTHCITRQKGEASLMCVHFDIARRYSDLLANSRPVRPAAPAPAGLFISYECCSATVPDVISSGAAGGAGGKGQKHQQVSCDAAPSCRM